MCFDREGSAEALRLLARLDWKNGWRLLVQGLRSGDEQPRVPAAWTPNMKLSISFQFVLAERMSAHWSSLSPPRKICTEDECRLIDAAAKQAALAAPISTSTWARASSAATLAEEVDRRTAESECNTASPKRSSILCHCRCTQSIGLSDCRLEQNRELGALGLPRGEVLGKKFL